MDLLFVGGAIVIFILLIIFFYFVPILLWINAKAAGVSISLLQLFLMRLRKVPAPIIVNAMIEAHKAGLLDIKRDDLEAHYLAGGVGIESQYRTVVQNGNRHRPCRT